VAGFFSELIGIAIAAMPQVSTSDAPPALAVSSEFVVASDTSVAVAVDAIIPSVEEVSIRSWK